MKLRQRLLSKMKQNPWETARVHHRPGTPSTTTETRKGHMNVIIEIYFTSGPL